MPFLPQFDVDAARSSPVQWEQVCRFFAGCARAAKAQGNTPRSGGRRMAEFLFQSFPATEPPSQAGFFEFMDWLNNPASFRPTSLRSALDQLSS